MARAIDGEAAYRFLSEQLVKETGAFSKGVNKGLNIARSAMRNPDAIPTLTPPNEPLSIEQLQEMDGEPVYIVFLPDINGEKLQFWALVAVDEWDDVYLANKDEWAFNYEEFLEDVEAIYRRPPEGEA